MPTLGSPIKYKLIETSVNAVSKVADGGVLDFDATDFVHTTTNPAQQATVGTNMFGAIVVNSADGQATSFASSVSYLNLSNIRYPGGELSENGSVKLVGGHLKIDISGGDQSAWISQTGSNYAYDLRYPDLMNPALLAGGTDVMSFSKAVALANANGTSIELVLPTVRYTDFGSTLTAIQETDLQTRCYGDVTDFLHNLFVTQSYGTPPSEAILDIGNENLIWTRAFDGEKLADGQKFDAKAVSWGIGLYAGVAEVMLSAAADFRTSHPDANFKMGIQVPYMNDQPGTDDPFDVFLRALKAMPTSEVAQIDLLRFHPLNYSFNYSAQLENWFSDDLRAYAAVINHARAVEGVDGPVQLIADAYTANGCDTGSSVDPAPLQSLQAAAATVAQFSSMVEMGVTYASAWGVAINYMQEVQASYYDTPTGTTHYTPYGEVLRQMSETLPGMTLINSKEFIDVDRTGPVNVQTYGDSTKYVAFVSANDINDGDSNDAGSGGYDVTLNLGNLSHAITYAWVETITCASGSSGEAVIWNPLLNAAGHEKGEIWLSFSGSSVTFHLSSDYEMVRLVISTGSSGTAAINLLGDSRLGLGVVDDVLKVGAGDDTIQGLSGSDTISGGAGNDQLYGDRADGSGATAGDRIKGGAGDDLIHGGGGDDTLWGDEGADSIYGGAGDDVIYYDGRADVVDGGDGYDTMILVPGTSSGTAVYARMINSPVAIGKGIEYLLGGGTNDNVVGNSEANKINGNDGDDSLAGWGGNDNLAGSAGRDRIWGGNGDDFIFGGSGRDDLYGGAGHDTLLGGGDQDRLTGGLGNDTFRFDSVKTCGDTITDFGTMAGNNDRITLDASAFNLTLSHGRLADRNFAVTTDDLVHQADEFLIYRSSDHTVWADTNGAAADGLILVAQFQGLSADLTAGDIFVY